MTDKPLRFATFLAPSILPVYHFIAEYVGQRLGYATELIVGENFAQFAEGEADIGFICGLPYVQLTRQDPPPIELLAAPVLQGERYAGKPVYYSDVIVHRDSPLHSFNDLRGRSWSYNDPDSHSGYNLTRYWLARMKENESYFNKIIAAGWHQESIRMVREGLVDASAIDSQVLAVALRDDPALGKEIRIIDALGPSTIQPVVAARHLSDGLKADVQALLLEMHSDPVARERLAYGLVERFAPASDATYDDIRNMLATVEAAGLAEW
ncbi:MAG TPA: PhnD/SsuA/transferrin family substrate-binding protein [Chloroflexia bacterium]|nr:PhnD/SsuA/transferrin family substrate-binding protein [Chloroflexia bacterium]